MAELQDVRYGWDFMAKLLGADLAGQRAFSDFAAATAQNSTLDKDAWNHKMKLLYEA